ncbi:DUF2207 domain-containing protein [Pelagibacterium xiamenense]|uniref:DUF2207 domain-containing protein n=1 Tax=Pelagibacterium xiamenense TaxID=2901140 RepID=UPI001E4070A7|nr:DUF2207 domain-containing protein [Pelagibacterium xiamenense]MCD7059279.1 DUF2207 domain-containing protein [Pelagibacterium xiamenense]
MTKTAVIVLCRAIIAVLALMAPAGGAFGAEVIERFNTDIAVHPDMSVTITETITVNAEGSAIRRGIFRDIPTVLEGPQGAPITSDLDVLSVTRNGATEPYDVESIRDGQRIRIGDADVFIARGLHTYEITYTMDRAARMFADHDELYWNATGNFWQFPILAAKTTVTLPEGADIIDLNVFTGAQGATGSAARAERVSNTVASFATTEPLDPYEGMTVAVAFEKGVLVAPSGGTAAWYWFWDNRGLIVPAILLLIVLAYNGYAWASVGRDPSKGVIIPRFYPPAGFSPALTHYVHRMGWQKNGWTAFSAALVSLATKELIEIGREGKKTITLKTTGKTPEAELPPGEEIIFEYLSGRQTVKINKKHGKSLNSTRSKFVSALQNENRSVYFRNNILYTLCGIAIGIASLGVMVLTGILDPLFLFFGLFASVFLSLFIFGLRSVWEGPMFGRFIAGLIGGVFLFNFGGLALDLFEMANVNFPVIAAVSIAATTIVFGILMRAPTVHGRRVMDEIEGFKMYLETAEKERLNFRDEPDMTVSRFETILPYAMALGVEKPWSERFENDLQRNAVRDADSSYSPRWYHGGDFSSGRFAATMSGVATGMAAAMVSAQPSSSSGSGFSGGGSSGGGGGGGGGGGW